MKNNKKTPKHQGTISTWGKIIVAAIEDMNGDVEFLLTSVGLKLEDINKVDSRIADIQLRELYQVCSNELGIESFGLYLGRYIKTFTFQSLGFALMVSKDIHDFLIRIENYGSVISNSAYAKLHLVESKQRFTVNIYKDQEGKPLIPPAAIEAFFVGLLNILKELTNQDLADVKVYLPIETPTNQQVYQDSFACQVQFNDAQLAIEFDQQTLEIPIISANHVLAEHQDKLVEMYLSKISSNLEQQVYYRVVKLLNAGNLSLDSLAEDMHLSTRNLQLKLKEHDTSFQVLRDKALQNEAQLLLGNSNYGITEIAYMLEFANGAGFTRAFKRWTGLSPAEFRKNNQADN